MGIMATAKSAPKVDRRTNPIAYVLEIVGSLIFIVLLIYTASSFSNYTSTSGLFALAAGGFWLPVLYAAAAVAPIMLFFASFSNLMISAASRGDKWPLCLSIISGFSWVALSAGSSGLTFVSIIGFIISLLGSVAGTINQYE